MVFFPWQKKTMNFGLEKEKKMIMHGIHAPLSVPSVCHFPLDSSDNFGSFVNWRLPFCLVEQ